MPPPAQISEQNESNGASAEDHLRRALELDRSNQSAMEYLAALYFWWRDPATGAFGRHEEAKPCVERLLEINPQHPFANYMRGMIDYENAANMIRPEDRLSAPAHG
jgi:tetratricopeptide (TPR) repeat protein